MTFSINESLTPNINFLKLICILIGQGTPKLKKCSICERKFEELNKMFKDTFDFKRK